MDIYSVYGRISQMDYSDDAAELSRYVMDIHSV